ncbi:hypothetical protein BH10ACT10_BH10ACT10_14340 [soil metagenome]
MNSMTSNPASVVDTEALTVRRTIQIAAPIEKVWSAVTEPEHISRWFGRAALDGRGAGASGSLTFGDRRVPLRVESMVEPTSISYRWGNDDALAVLPDEVDDAHSTVFTFTLDPVDGGTRLTLVESGFELTSAPVANLEDHRSGWDSELDKLVALLEGGS